MCRLRNSYVSVTDRQTDRQTTDKVIPMCRYASQTDGQTDRQTDDGQSDPYVSLCFSGGTKKGYYKYFPTSCILFTAWIFCPKFNNFRPIQLDIIDCIFEKFMNQHCAKFYTNTRTNIDTTMLSIFAIFAWNLNILPKKSNWGHIKPDIIINVFCKVMEYPCA